VSLKHVYFEFSGCFPITPLPTRQKNWWQVLHLLMVYSLPVITKPCYLYLPPKYLYIS